MSTKHSDAFQWFSSPHVNTGALPDVRTVITADTEERAYLTGIMSNELKFDDLKN